MSTTTPPREPLLTNPQQPLESGHDPLSKTGALPENPTTSVAVTGQVLARSRQMLEGRLEKPKPTHAEMIGGGGTWAMRIGEHGSRRGEGKLGDEELRRLQQDKGLFTIDFSDPKRARALVSELNRGLAAEIYTSFQQSLAQPSPSIKEQIGHWCTTRSGEAMSDYVEGDVRTLYSGDSSQLRPYLTAPIVMTVLEQIAKNPDTPRVLGMGTDTADLVTPTLDAFLFDADAAPIFVTGANHPHEADDSDAPENFVAAGKLAGKQIPSGAHYVFGRGENLFSGIDMVKVDPSEDRKGGIEGQSTFYAPQGTNHKVNTVLKFAPNRPTGSDATRSIRSTHVLQRIDFEKLYDAMSGTLVVDLGDQNPGEVIMDQIFDPSIKTVIVAGHSLGNADNEIRHYLVQAALMGKTVIVVSRTLIGKTDATYDAALLKENEPGGKLHNSGHEFVEGSGLNPAAARAIATRGIVENLEPQELQELIQRWRSAREIGKPH